MNDWSYYDFVSSCCGAYSCISQLTQCGNSRLALIQRMHRGFDRDRLAVPRRTVVDDAPLPRHLQILIRLPAIEETVHIPADRILHVLVQNHIVPAGLGHALPQLRGLQPAPAVEHPHLAVQLVRPPARRQQQAVRRVRGRREHVLVRDAGVRAAAVAALGDEDNVLLALPVEQELAELDVLRQRAVVAVQPRRGRREDAPAQAVRLVVDGREAAVAGAGEGEEVAGGLRDDGQVQVGVFAAQGVDEDGVGVGAWGGGVVEVGARGVVLGWGGFGFGAGGHFGRRCGL